VVKKNGRYFYDGDFCEVSLNPLDPRIQIVISDWSVEISDPSPTKLWPMANHVSYAARQQ
jgi:hypothetical protein